MSDRTLLAAVLLANGWVHVSHGAWAQKGPRRTDQVALQASDGTVADIDLGRGDVTLFSPEGWLSKFETSIPNRVVFGAAVATTRSGASA